MHVCQKGECTCQGRATGESRSQVKVLTRSKAHGMHNAVLQVPHFVTTLIVTLFQTALELCGRSVKARSGTLERNNRYRPHIRYPIEFVRVGITVLSCRTKNKIFLFWPCLLREDNILTAGGYYTNTNIGRGVKRSARSVDGSKASVFPSSLARTQEVAMMYTKTSLERVHMRRPHEGIGKGTQLHSRA